MRTAPVCRDGDGDRDAGQHGAARVGDLADDARFRLLGRDGRGSRERQGAGAKRKRAILRCRLMCSL